MTEQQRQYQIVAGPSREEIFDALRLRHEGREVVITVQFPDETKRMAVSIDGIEAEDDYGSNWKIKLGGLRFGKDYLVACYSTVRRRGSLKVASLVS